MDQAIFFVDGFSRAEFGNGGCGHYGREEEEEERKEEREGDATRWMLLGRARMTWGPMLVTRGFVGRAVWLVCAERGGSGNSDRLISKTGVCSGSSDTFYSCACSRAKYWSRVEIC